ncbi:zinc finger CCCH domain-containing protein 32 [Lactuca sativa]|uniref:C3H1-type domain-containing protein n=1 Tax=Lactuca sativa TaxID=4236 RepID=A0A9R1VDA1_LACSA|nr:zinc finger CCCH domain-containing protein 32 [Lactuca sativa]KAJ0202586.1 hypothetical protein LSAT_V11C500297770 [Lactuca sativa]
MELYGRSTGRNGSQTDHTQQPEWIQPGTETGLEESMRRLGLWGGRGGEFYPERPGTADCAYYMRTGTCGYGSKCRYNHPPDRSSSAGGAARSVGGGGAYPERPGEPPCQYYLRTGTCKFGASCKFHHPRHAGGSLSNVPLNTYGYPLRPEEKECSYYLKTGQCKFGITCKFHHPQPTGESMSASASARPFYSTVQSTSPEQQQQQQQQFVGGPGGGYRVASARPPLVPGSYAPAAAYGPILLSPGMLPLPPNWSPYSGRVSPVLSPGAPQPQPASVYGVNSSFAGAGAGAGAGGHFRPLPPPSPGPSQTERVFPERPGQPECQYYMKTGDCKFGASCKYHHPPDWVLSQANCMLSPIGLPLRPGVEACNFYMQNGHCKFGRTCKFDHPLPGAVTYGGPSELPIPTIPASISFSERSKMDTMFTQGQTQTGSSPEVQISGQTSPQTR